MTAIWRNDGGGWALLAPEGFPDEAALHSLIEKAPELLPLAGARQLTIVGREVNLGSGTADLIAIEPSGRLVLLEVKLSRNAEARRAIVAQILAYAAYLRGLTPQIVEQQILGRHLQDRGFDSLADAADASYQEGKLDREVFSHGLAESLERGQFRLVLVLDEAPDELSRLIGYLESVADRLLIDLVTVGSYRIEGSQIIVPQRVEAESKATELRDSATLTRDGGKLVDGADDFVASIDGAARDQAEILRRLADWAVSLQDEGIVSLQTYHGKAGILTLLPRLRADNVGLVTIWHDGSGGYLQFWRSVFERRAPATLPRVEQITNVGQGNTARDISAELLEALTAAYREAAAGRVQG